MFDRKAHWSGCGLESTAEKNAVVPVAAWQMLQRQRDEIAEAPFRHGVLTRKETVVRIEAELVTPFHCPGENGGSKFSCQAGGHRSFKENPDVSAATGTQPFSKGGGNVPVSAGLKECPHVICQVVLSKSEAKNQHVSSVRSG